MPTYSFDEIVSALGSAMEKKRDRAQIAFDGRSLFAHKEVGGYSLHVPVGILFEPLKEKRLAELAHAGYLSPFCFRLDKTTSILSLCTFTTEAHPAQDYVPLAHELFVQGEKWCKKLRSIRTFVPLLGGAHA